MVNLSFFNPILFLQLPLPCLGALCTSEPVRASDRVRQFGLGPPLPWSSPTSLGETGPPLSRTRLRCTRVLDLRPNQDRTPLPIRESIAAAGPAGRVLNIKSQENWQIARDISTDGTVRSPDTPNRQCSIGFRLCSGQACVLG
jgi:hypothetical protein